MTNEFGNDATQSDLPPANQWAESSAEAQAQPTSAESIQTEPIQTEATPTPEPSPALAPRPVAYAAAPASQPRRAARTSLTVVLALVAGVLGGVVDHFAFDSGSTGTALTQLAATSTKRPEGSIAALAAKVTPSVVAIQVEGWQGSSEGSGLIIRPDGYILTNHHVVAGVGNTPSITVVFADGSKTKGTVVGSNTAYDLAVVKVDKTGLPAVTLGNSDSVVVGDPVIAIGSPLGLQGTVTSGIVSALDRPVTTGDGTGASSSYISAIQTDAAINPGNSGGPLIDSQGAVIGVNSAIATLGSSFGSQSGSIGLGFAIPVNQAKRIAEEIMSTGSSKVPVMGVSIDMGYQGDGARIAKVVKDGGAAKAGLTANSVITAVDGNTIADATELITTIRSHQPGDILKVTTAKGKTFTVILGGDTATN